MKKLDLDILEENFRTGDYKVISEILDCGKGTVRDVLKGRRSSETILGNKIVEVASSIVLKRLELQEEFK